MRPVRPRCTVLSWLEQEGETEPPKLPLCKCREEGGTRIEDQLKDRNRMSADEGQCRAVSARAAVPLPAARKKRRCQAFSAFGGPRPFNRPLAMCTPIGRNTKIL
jgi:hypothetical protein